MPVHQRPQSVPSQPRLASVEVGHQRSASARNGLVSSGVRRGRAFIVLGRRTIFELGWTLEIPKVVILLVTIGLLLRFKKLPEPLVVLGAAVVGWTVFPFGHD